MANRLWIALLPIVLATSVIGVEDPALEAGSAFVFRTRDNLPLVMRAGDALRLRLAEVGGRELVLRVSPVDRDGVEIGSGRIVVLQPFEIRDMRLRDEFADEALTANRLQVEVLKGGGRVSVGGVDLLPEPDAAQPKRRAVGPHVQPPSSFDLIDQAEASGAIDGETALLDRVYALFGDARLPAKYRGDDSQVEDSLYMADVRQKFSSLSPATQAAVQPFLIPPAYADSWVNAKAGSPSVASGTPPPCQAFSRNWASVDAINSPVRVWYQTALDGQALVASHAAVEIDKFWPALTGLMHRSPGSPGLPLSDATEDCNGGDGRLDIYLSDPATEGVTVPYSSCAPTASFIEIDHSLPIGALIHEIFHAIQDSFPLAGCSLGNADYRWWTEGSAKWSEDYICETFYPAVESELPSAIFLLNHTQTELDEAAGTIPWHAYGTYLLPFYIHRSTGSADFVLQAWQNCAKEPALEAVSDAIGGFDKVWPEFAKHNWNRPPVDDYRKWDDITIGAKETAPNQRLSADTRVYDLDYDLPRLTASYYDIKFQPNDSSVVFWNGVTNSLALRDLSGGVFGPQYVVDPASADQTKGAHVAAMVRMGDSWTTEDWTGRESVTYCRDLLAERIDEIVLVISNSEFKNRDFRLKPPGLAPVVLVSDVGCWRWKGKASVSGGGTVAQASVTWTRIEQSTSPFAIQYSADGTLDWSVSQTGCTAGGSAPLGGAPAALSTYNFAPPDSAVAGTYYGTGNGPSVPVCSASFSFPWWTAPPPPIVPGSGGRFLRVSGNGKVMDDAFSLPGSPTGWTWHFEADRQ